MQGANTFVRPYAALPTGGPSESLRHTHTMPQTSPSVFFICRVPTHRCVHTQHCQLVDHLRVFATHITMPQTSPSVFFVCRAPTHWCVRTHHCQLANRLRVFATPMLSHRHCMVYSLYAGSQHPSVTIQAIIDSRMLCQSSNPGISWETDLRI
jgi:hypothetical protein